MANVTTTYDIQVRMKMAKDINKANRALSGMSKSMRTVSRIAKAGVFGFGAKAALGALVGYNTELQNTQTRLTAMFQGNLGGTFADNQKRASMFMKQLKTDAAATPGTFKDMTSFTQQIASHVTQAGGSMEDLRQITKGGVVAAAVFGEEAGLAARDIQQALSGNLGSKDRFARQLIATMGYSTQQWNKEVRSNPNKGIQLLNQAFNQAHIKDAAKAYEKSFAGVSSTLKSQLQEVIGLVGKPLTEEITKEMVKATAWLKANQDKVKAFAKSAGKALGKAFKMLASAMKFLYRNRGSLEALAKALIAFKAVGAITSGFSTLAGALNSTRAGLSGFSGHLALAAAGVVGFLHALKTGREAKKKADKTIHQGEAFESMRRMMNQNVKQGRKLTEDRGLMGHARKMFAKQGFVGEDGRIDLDKVRRHSDTIRGVGGKGRLGVDLSDHLTSTSNFNIMQVARALNKQQAKTATPPELKKGTQAHSSNLSVGKIVIEVASDDPDRFAMGLETMFQDLVKNPAQAKKAFSEG